jgi:hypothetical protein
LLVCVQLTCATAATLMDTRYCPYVDTQPVDTAVDVYELMLKLTLDVLGEGASYCGGCCQAVARC